MFNPMQMMEMFSGRSNPQQVVSQMMNQQLQNNPLFQRAQQMAQGKSPQELEQVAKNLCKQRGIDLDSAMKQFQQMMGYK
jgi:hypothetical protein